ncbi:TPA: type III-B CRISPR module-associated Cmr3 family protein [Streptococcus suis]
MSSYKVLLKPLECYHFPNEQNFWHGKRQDSRELDIPYYSLTELMPSQTTVLGMLRYLILKKNNQLGFDDKVDQCRREELIGKESFAFDSEIQSFGRLKSLGPLHLISVTNEEECLLIPTPLNMGQNKRSYSLKIDDNHNYYFSDFSSKTFVPSFLTIKPNGAIDFVDESAIFSKVYKSRVDTSERTGNNNKDSFFKLEMLVLKDQYLFQFYVDIDEEMDGQPELVFLGGNKSLFEIRFEKVEESFDEHVFLPQSIVNRIRNSLAGNPTLEPGMKVYYCLSDTYGCQEQLLFATSTMKSMRNLRTTQYSSDIKSRFEAGSLITLFGAGSVLYADRELSVSENARNIGLNQLIEIGEKK